MLVLQGPYLFFWLPNTFMTFAAENIGGKGPNPSFLAHCAREMYHTQWSIILNNEFLKAYRHGIVVKCYDQISHCFYPRIFTHSADYKEKYVLTMLLENLPDLNHILGYF